MMMNRATVLCRIVIAAQTSVVIGSLPVAGLMALGYFPVGYTFLYFGAAYSAFLPVNGAALLIAFPLLRLLKREPHWHTTMLFSGIVMGALQALIWQNQSLFALRGTFWHIDWSRALAPIFFFVTGAMYGVVFAYSYEVQDRKARARRNKMPRALPGIIRAARESRGLLIPHMASVAGVSEPCYNDIEAYDDEVTSNVDVEILFRICHELEINPLHLFANDPPTSGVALEDLRLRTVEWVSQSGLSLNNAWDQIGWDLTGFFDNSQEALQWSIDALADVCAVVKVPWTGVLSQAYNDWKLGQLAAI